MRAVSFREHTYSEGGNSLELKEEFRAFSSSKLSEMLTLPDNEIQLITERTTIREIRELKEFNRQEIPVATSQQEEEGPGTENEPPAAAMDARDRLTPYEKCIMDFFKDKGKMLNGIMGSLAEDPADHRKAMETMNPSGQSSHKKGLIFLFLYDWDTGVKYKVLTQPEPVSLTWTEFLDDIMRIYGSCDPLDVWGDFYGAAEGIPVATSQREEEGPGTDVGNTPGNPEEDAEAVEETQGGKEGPPAAAVKGAGDPTEGEQLPGQREVYDYPELLPAGMEEEGNGTGGTDAAGSIPAADGGEDPITDDGGQDPGDVPEPDAGNGTAEDGGCEEDHGDADDGLTEEDAWETVGECLDEIRHLLVCVRDRDGAVSMQMIKAMYLDAIDLAAALEGIMIRRGKNG